MTDYIPPGGELCPEQFEKVKLIATRLLKWELLGVEHFGTEECSARQIEIEKEFPGFLDNAHAGQVYWVNPYHKLIQRVDRFNPFISPNDAFLVLTRMRDYGHWTLEFPDRDNARATFAPYDSDPITFICHSLENAITTVACEWLRKAVPE